jgi:hypothetical protein
MTSADTRSWDEQRKGHRLSIERPVGVAIVPKLLGFLARRPRFECAIRNASTHGVQLRSTRTIPMGAAVRLWVHVQMGTDLQTLVLTGDVLWSKPDKETGEMLAGVQLHDHPKKAMEIWTSMILGEMRRRDS